MFVRKFNNTEVDFVPLNQVSISPYFPYPLSIALYNHTIKDTDYILCPYFKHGDVQIGMTGTLFVSESSYYMGLLRELGEELGLKPKNKFSTYWLANKQLRHKRMSVYIGKINEMVPLTEEEGQVGWTEQDDRTRKVGCLIYGSNEDILKYLHLPKHYRYINADAIVGLAILKVGDIKELFSINAKKLRIDT